MPNHPVTSKGQITLGKNVMRHLGIEPGDNVSIDLLPDGTATLAGVRTGTGVERFFGMLYDPDQPTLSIEEINEITADAWAGIRARRKPTA
jgi:antitoxin PrlF